MLAFMPFVCSGSQGVFNGDRGAFYGRMPRVASVELEFAHAVHDADIRGTAGAVAERTGLDPG